MSHPESNLSGALAQAPTSRLNPERFQAAWLHDSLGLPIRVRLLDGKVVLGRLQAFDQYSWLVDRGGNRATLIYKHAIAYAEPFQGQGGER